MKQQFRFLVAGFSLIGVLVYHAIPAEAQILNTKFTVTLVTLSMTVTPSQVAFGSKGAGSAIRSEAGGTLAPFFITNTSAIEAIVQIAATNAKSTSESSENPSWMLEITNGQDMFRFAVGTVLGSYTGVLEGPSGPGDTFYPTAGPIIEVPGGKFIAGANRTLHWEMIMPNSSTKTGAQEWLILFQAASAP